MSPTPKTTFFRDTAKWGQMPQFMTRLRNAAIPASRSSRVQGLVAAMLATGTDMAGAGITAGGRAGIDGLEAAF
jgi:hypothetical protein